MQARALAIVLAALLPATAAAAQFAPPTGWSPNPSLQEQPVPRIWLPSDASGTTAQPAIWAEVIPLPNPLVVADEFSVAAPSDVAVTSASTTLCGSPARVLTASSRNGGNTSELVFERSHDVSYVVSYFRPASATEDRNAAAFVLHFCPVSPDAIDALRAPPGWRLMPAMQITGAWSDPTSQQNIALLSGPPMPALWAVMETALALLTPEAGISVQQRPPFTLCGQPADESLATLTIPGLMGLNIDAIATQSPTTSYLLVYQGAAPQATAVNAMHAFCPR